MIGWLTAAAYGTTVLKTGTVCVELRPAFANAIGDDGMASMAHPAHGLSYRITDALATYDGYLLDKSGCLDDYPVFAEATGGKITLTVFSRARLLGIPVESWQGADHHGPRSFETASFVLSTGSTTKFSTRSTVVGDDQRWRNLSLAAVLFWGQEWDIALPEDRPMRAIHLQSDPTARPDTCCRGTLRDTDDVLGNEPLGLYTGTDAPYRSRIAQTLRQVLSRIHSDLTRGWSCGRSRLSWWIGGAGYRRCP